MKNKEITNTQELALQGIKARFEDYKRKLNEAEFEMDDYTWDVLWNEASDLMAYHKIDETSVEGDLEDIFDYDSDLIGQALQEFDFDELQINTHTCLRAGREWSMIYDLKDSQKKAGDKITSLKKELEEYKFAIKEAGYRFSYNYETKRGVIQRDV